MQTWKRCREGEAREWSTGASLSVTERRHNQSNEEHIEFEQAQEGGLAQTPQGVQETRSQAKGSGQILGARLDVREIGERLLKRLDRHDGHIAPRR